MLRTILPTIIGLILCVWVIFRIAVPYLRVHMMESKQAMIRELTQTGWMLLKGYDQQVQQGSLTLEEAQHRAMEQVRHLFHGPMVKDYYWIIDRHGTMVMHPYRTDLEGRNMIDYTDPSGAYIFRDFLETANRHGQGYIDYLWQRHDDPQTISRKQSYLKLFEPWGWIIGTGAYTGDIDTAVEKITTRLNRMFSIILAVVIVLSAYLIRQTLKAEDARFQSLVLFQESELRYRMLVESMDEGLSIQDNNDCLVYVNEACCRILGYTREELLGCDIASLLNDASWEILQKETARRKVEQTNSVYELVWKGKDGNPITTLISARPFYDERNQLVGTFALITDLTDQRRKERNLIESEERFRTTFEIIPSITSIIRKRDVTYVEINAEFTNLLGYNRADVIGKTLEEVGAYADPAELASARQAFKNHGRIVNQALSYRAKDGSIRRSLTSARLINLNNEAHIIVFSRDTTEQMEVEAKYRSILQNIEDGYCEVDVKGRYVTSNEALAVILGYSTAELATMRFQDYTTLESTEELKRKFSGLYKSGKSIKAFETQFVRKGGDIGYVELSVTPIRDTAHNFIGFSSIIRDITLRKKATMELEWVRRKLQNTIDMMPSMLVAVDSTMRVTQWNREAAGKTGWLSKDALGKPFAELLPLFREQVTNIHTSILERSTYREEKVSVIEDNEMRIYDIIIYPLANDEGAVVRMDDITTRVGMEEMMIQTEKMMSVGELAAGMAHEINNPLGGILQGAQNIVRRISPGLERNTRMAAESGIDLDKLQVFLEKQHIFRYIDGIREAGGRAAKIVSRMLQFSRRSESSMAPILLPDAIDRAIELANNDYSLKRKYDFKKIKIIKEYARDMQPVPCVATEIEQVILNLLKNSAQAIGTHGGNPTPQISIRTFGKEEMAHIEIRDNGPGMEEKTRKRIFEPFFTTKQVGEGTGLGLSVSYMIITNNHKGTIEAASIPGDGSVFTIRLPFYRPDICAPRN